MPSLIKYFADSRFVGYHDPISLVLFGFIIAEDYFINICLAFYSSSLFYLSYISESTELRYVNLFPKLSEDNVPWLLTTANTEKREPSTSKCALSSALAMYIILLKHIDAHPRVREIGRYP